jgi:TonB family protein
MDAATLGNLVQWNLQVALIVAAAAALVRVLDVSAPSIRYALWRIVLFACLALPLVQPWRAPASNVSQPVEIAIPAPTDQPSLDGATGRASLLAGVSRHWRRSWHTYVTGVVVAGITLRLLWLLMGIVRLQRLRRVGRMGATTTSSYGELTALIEAGAEIRHVDRLGQPVTFGVLRPAVLLPASFDSMPEGVQRAVLAHELWHVRRRDWAWVLFEEAVRAAFWYNPAMSWLLSRVQSSREEVVDELTVQVTNARKTYLEALLAFADQPTLFPASPFARRRHLFHRMLLISREAAMSSRRIVASAASTVAVLLATGVYGSSLFPLKAAPAAVAAAPANTAGQQTPPRDRRPGEAGPETARERELKQLIETGQAKSAQYFELARLQEARGAMVEAESTLVQAESAFVAATRASEPRRDALQTLAAFYNRQGQFDKTIATLEDLAAMTPGDPQGYQLVAVYYWEKAFKDLRLNDARKRAYIESGIDATDRALAINDSYVDALTYKNILLRMKANMETDAASRQALIAEADALRSRAIELQKSQPKPNHAFSPLPGQAPPPPPPPPPLPDGLTPVRIGGHIKPPVKVRDVKPVYPPVALESRVQGVVIIEIVVDTAGFVSDGKILRGQPLLDEAALDAVRQWQFQPTVLNGVPVPVIMTVTVNFTLPQ